jgi:hypothetical protein
MSLFSHFLTTLDLKATNRNRRSEAIQDTKGDTQKKQNFITISLNVLQ